MKEKSYIECINGISANRLYDGLLGAGLFADTLPPVFTSESYLEYCKSRNPAFPNEESPYIIFENMRNNGKSRQMGIPNPFCYERLCGCIRDNWEKIKAYFETRTKGQRHKVSQLHIRSIKDAKSLFKMNYKSLAERCNPIVPRLIGEGGFSARYMVETDIAKCFPSIYSHALVWALEGKDWAKEHREDHELWQIKLDYFVRNLKFGETNGLLIGPHASNLLSEIILTRVDECLSSIYKYYIRHIDDYNCYVETHEEAERFIVDQRKELKKYGLSLNESKTKIYELPIVSEDDWVRRLNDFTSLLPGEKLELKHVRSFLDYVIELAANAKNDSVISYAMSIVKDMAMTGPAREYYCRTILHLASLHSYLYRFLDERLFVPFFPDLAIVKSFSERMFEHGLRVHNYEEVSYSIYFSIRYGIRLDGFDAATVLDVNDCVLAVMALLYVRYWNEDDSLIRAKAKKLASDEIGMWENWLFVYEALTVDELGCVKKFGNEVRAIKRAKVSFLRSEEATSAIYSRNLRTKFASWHWSLVSLGNDAKRKIEDLKAVFIRECEGIEPKHCEYLEMLLANLFIGRLLRYNVSIPRSKTAYERYHLLDAKDDPIEGDKIKVVVNWLSNKGYIGERIGEKGEGVSYYWARNPLSDVFDSLDAGNVCTLSLKNALKPPVILKDETDNEIDVDWYEDKREYYIDKLNSINLFYAGKRMAFQPGFGMRRQPLHPRLVAVFNNGDWNQGGRLYAHERFEGVNYQSLNSETRSTIEIEDQPTIERDFRALHVSMLYAREGKQYSADPYAVVDMKFRPLAKAAMLRLLNADSREVAVASLRKDCESLEGVEGLSLRKSKLVRAYEECEDLDKIFTQLEVSHEPIAKYFYSGVGLSLQAVDSLMALELVSHFADKGIVVLPVHDSFIVQSKYDEELVTKMKEVYSRFNNGFVCEVK